LGGLLDPTTLAGDLTALLPGAAADLPAGRAAELLPNLAGMLLDPSTILPFEPQIALAGSGFRVTWPRPGQRRPIPASITRGQHSQLH
jgi:hypothetical protein